MVSQQKRIMLHFIQLISKIYKLLTRKKPMQQFLDQRPYKLKPTYKQLPACFLKCATQQNLSVAFSWNTDNLHKLCEMLLQWRVIKLLLTMNDVPSILKQIQYINFPALQVMCITNSNIQSIEPLCNIYAPYLRYINLDSNNITGLRNFTKCFLPSLQTISLNQNKIIESHYLNQIYAPHLKSIYIQVSSQLPQPDQYMNWVTKLQNHKFQRLTIAYKKRIQVRRMIKAIRSQYGQDSLWDFELELQSYYQT